MLETPKVLFQFSSLQVTEPSKTKKNLGDESSDEDDESDEEDSDESEDEKSPPKKPVTAQAQKEQKAGQKIKEEPAKKKVRFVFLQCFLCGLERNCYRLLGFSGKVSLKRI